MTVLEIKNREWVAEHVSRQMLFLSVQRTPEKGERPFPGPGRRRHLINFGGPPFLTFCGRETQDEDA